MPFTPTDQFFQAWSPFPTENSNNVPVTTDFEVAIAQINNYFAAIPEYLPTSPGIVDAGIILMATTHLARECPISFKHKLAQCIAFHIEGFWKNLTTIAETRGSELAAPNIDPAVMISLCLTRSDHLFTAFCLELDGRGV